jgi:hypothetical protein
LTTIENSVDEEERIPLEALSVDIIQLQSALERFHTADHALNP